MTPTTNPRVISAAQSPTPLPLAETTLIGIFWKTDEARALIRQPDGRIVTLEIGDRLGNAEVSAIAQDGIYLTEGGQQSVLVLPPLQPAA
jgi:hypothetical protein